jgi:hypothetical protein
LQQVALVMADGHLTSAPNPATQYALTLVAMPSDNMKRLIGLTFFILLNSCSTDETLNKYNKIIDDCDKVKIFRKTGEDFKLVMEITDRDELMTLKAILKRDVNPEMQGKFLADKRFEIYKGDHVIGQLLIKESDETPFVNFVCDDFGFGFRLTYGIGMYPN